MVLFIRFRAGLAVVVSAPARLLATTAGQLRRIRARAADGDLRPVIPSRLFRCTFSLEGAIDAKPSKGLSLTWREIRRTEPQNHAMCLKDDGGDSPGRLRDPQRAAVAYGGAAGVGSCSLVKVLLIDDSRLARMASKQALAKLRPDWSIVEAAAAAEAVELLRRMQVDLIMLDYNMPGQNGLDLAESLRFDGLQIPIALVTANFQVDVVRRAGLADLTFLAKPIVLPELERFLSLVSA